MAERLVRLPELNLDEVLELDLAIGMLVRVYDQLLQLSTAPANVHEISKHRLIAGSLATAIAEARQSIERGDQW